LGLIGIWGVECGIAAPKEPPPPAAATALEFIPGRLPSEREKWAGYSVPASSFGVTTSTRGSLLAGLLLGPVGVAVNVAQAMSESERQAVPLKQLLSTDLRKALGSLLPNASFAEAPTTGGHFTLVPSAALDFRSDDEFKLRCALNVALVDGGKEIWQSRYLVQVEGLFVRNVPSDIDNAVAEAGSCLEKAYSLFRRHKTNELGPYKDYSVRADYNLSVPVLESALPDRVIYSDHLGLFEYRKSDVRSVTPR
jgi:hypothetical protein